MGVTPLRDDQILIRKGVDKPAKGGEPFPITKVNKVFAKNSGFDAAKAILQA